ncbi:hypothetical protein AXF42_Ash014659 [Apostasia shenzhenica]|uniref:Uncharacterized protein n=1 Tax=Apostasia shenzhenica TaxID=1088818 RepID=A0A2I0AKB7_9ASPA|nr:hypothetical protein AXF42_Ash014659 [Apostasia shenzhenica]
MATMRAASTMASPLPSSTVVHGRTMPRRTFITQRAKAQRPDQNDDSSNETKRPSASLEDINMGLLRERMEVVRMRKRLQKWYTEQEGWNYLPS